MRLLRCVIPMTGGKLTTLCKQQLCEEILSDAKFGGIDAPLTKNGKSKPVLITGGAGFVGSNLAHRLLSAGYRVRLLDNLSRAGVERNLQWLIETHGDLVDMEVPDVRDTDRENYEPWFDRMMAALEPFELTVTFCFTPESKGINPHHTSAPRHLEEYADFCTRMVRRYA